MEITLVVPAQIPAQILLHHFVMSWWYVDGRMIRLCDHHTLRALRKLLVVPKMLTNLYRTTTNSAILMIMIPSTIK